MSKKIKPMEGQPAEVLLSGIQADVHRPDSSEWNRREWTDEGEKPGLGAIEGVVPRIGSYVDSDVCLNWWQAIALRRDIARICRDGSNVENPDVNRPRLALQVHKIKSLDGIHRVALLVNSSRHTCKNCLAEDCFKRDPDAPLAEVKARDLKEYGCSIEFLFHQLELPENVRNKLNGVLWREGITQVKDLLECSESDLLKIRGFGPKSLMYIKKGLANNGLELRKSLPEYEADEEMANLLEHLSIRTVNCIENAKIGRLEDLLKLSESDLLKTRCFGRKSIKELQIALATLGLRLVGEKVTS